MGPDSKISIAISLSTSGSGSFFCFLFATPVDLLLRPLLGALRFFDCSTADVNPASNFYRIWSWSFAYASSDVSSSLAMPGGVGGFLIAGGVFDTTGSGGGGCCNGGVVTSATVGFATTSFVSGFTLCKAASAVWSADGNAVARADSGTIVLSDGTSFVSAITSIGFCSGCSGGGSVSWAAVPSSSLTIRHDGVMIASGRGSGWKVTHAGPGITILSVSKSDDAR
jgi:hypothetical protein